MQDQLHGMKCSCSPQMYFHLQLRHAKSMAGAPFQTGWNTQQEMCVTAAHVVVNSPLGTFLQDFFNVNQNLQRDQMYSVLLRGCWKSVQTPQNIILKKKKSYL